MKSELFRSVRWEIIKATLYFLLGYGLMVNALMTGEISTRRGDVIFLESSPELFWFGVVAFSIIGSYGLWKFVNVFVRR